MTPKWKKRGLFLIPPVLLGSIVSSVVATEWHGRIGKLGFNNSKYLKKQIEQFIQASNEQGGQSSTKNITAVDLISQLAKNPNSVPLLMIGFATQIAKSIFDGKLFEGTKYSGTIGKNFQTYLKGQKKQAEQSIKTKRSTEKRVKTDWSSDDERYLTGLKDFILGQIDSRSIDNYYHQDGYKLTTKKKFEGRAIAFIGFLLAKWIGKSHVGRFIHEVLPYSDSFQEKTTELYRKKFQNVNLPSKPNFHFPDFNPSAIEKFQETIDLWAGSESSWKDVFLGPNKEELEKKLKNKSSLHWVSKDNTSQKNLALKLLSKNDTSSSKPQKTDNGSENLFTKALSFLWGSAKAFVRPHIKTQGNVCKNNSQQPTASEIPKLKDLWLDLKQDPLKLFCISDSDDSKQNIEFLIHSDKSSGSKKIIFWRDDKGFNLLFPVTVKNDQQLNGGKKNSESDGSNEKFHKSKEQWVEQFREYVKENFPYLLLKYYLHIKGCDGAKPSKPKTCCCEDIIKNLTKLWELSKRLIELNNSLKVWDLRSKNNTFLKTVDYSKSSDYLSKLGTVSANPPAFLSKVSFEDEIKGVHASIKDHLKKVGDYFSSTSKHGSETKLEGKQQNGKNDNKDQKYWTFNSGATPQKTNSQDPNCMKKSVAEFLLEKTSTLDLLKNHLLLSISFDKITELIQNGENVFQSQNSLKKLEEGLSKNYQDFFKFQDSTGTSGGGGRTRRQAPASPPTNNEKLIDLLLKAIKDELVVSNLGSISDTLLYKLSKNNSNGTQGKQANNSDNFETIKDWLTINALSNQPLKTANTLENSKLRLLITSLYLLENSMKEYRDLLKSIIKNDFFGSYAFSLSWNKFCTPEESKNPTNPDQDTTSSGARSAQGSGGDEKSSFWSPIDSKSPSSSKQGSSSEEEWSSSNLDPRACIRNADRFSTATFKKKTTTNGAPAPASSSPSSNNSEMKLMGYKGSISRNSQLHLPGNLYEKILDFLLKEGHITWKQIEDQVDLIKSNRQFSDFIKQLTKIKSSIGQAFELPDYKTLKEDLDQSKRAEALEWLGLTKKKELLKKFIKKHLFSGNTSLQQVSSEPKNDKKNDKPSFRGLMWDKESTSSREEEKTYIFSTRDENEGSALIYLIQYTSEDLKDEKTFAKFLTENLTPDMLIRDIVKKAQDKGLQSKAINHYLMRGSWATGDKVFNLKSNDYYLKDQFSSIIL